jgi:hypothetical protein
MKKATLQCVVSAFACCSLQQVLVVAGRGTTAQSSRRDFSASGNHPIRESGRHMDSSPDGRTPPALPVAQNGRARDRLYLRSGVRSDRRLVAGHLHDAERLPDLVGEDASMAGTQTVGFPAGLRLHRPACSTGRALLGNRHHGRLNDGVALVIQSDRTRRVTAQKAKEILQAANVKVLSTALSERTFPIPEAIYRNL